MSIRLNIRAKNFTLTPSIREEVEKGVSSLERLVASIPGGEAALVEFEVMKTTRHHLKGDVFVAEANMALPGAVLRAEETHSDLHAAISRVRHLMQEEIRKYKEVGLHT
ncbi:MAG: ribosome-associated translation inhibitor RaiA [Candidatus Colwellbacteria bacterium]|nr:ribosome-associated translation inhibitor RaiA [Candidatus Colwellbacteria bacterium]